MAKKVYGIPYDINKGQVDRQFQLQLKSQGVKLTKRPITMLTLLIWVGAIMVWMFLMMRTFIGRGSIIGAIIFTIAYYILLYFLSKQDATRRYGYQLLGVYVTYVLKKARELVLRRNTNLTKAQQFFGIREIIKDGPESGVMRHVDGRWARLYVVAGNASTMLYEEDKTRILDTTERFYRNFNEYTDIIFDTVREPQSVDDQLYYNDLRRAQVYDETLLALFDEAEYYMNVGVNGYQDPKRMIRKQDVDDVKTGHYSIRQYMMLISDDKAQLLDAENQVFENSERGGYTFKYVRAMDYEDVEKYYRELYN